MVTLKALLDTGATATLISSEHVEKQKKNQCNKTTQKIIDGKLFTKKTAKIGFTIP